jgi:hypothetical protein
MGVIIRWRRGAYKILFFTIDVLKKKMAILNWWARYEFITPAYSYYARLFLLRPVLFPGCYGHVYVFRILGELMQLY